VKRIAADGAATVSAAPGAGKTVFAALVFEALYEADVVDRMVVLLDICRGQRFHLYDKRCEKGVDGLTRSRTDVFQSGRYCSRRVTSWLMPNSKCQ